MTTTAQPLRRSRAKRATRGMAGYGFVSLYAMLLLGFGVIPAIYAVYLSLVNRDGAFAGLSNFTRVSSDFRFGPALGHVAIYLTIWLVSLLVLVVGLAVTLHSLRRTASSVLRFLYYLPGALAGAASVLVWLFMLDPSVSPVGSLLKALGYHTFIQSVAPGHLPVIFALMAFWTGAGGWIIVMYGALNNISAEILESAHVDGANAWQIAWHIQIPMLRKWIVYMVILAFATGTQLFVEPQLVGEASLGGVSNSWSLNQLGYVLAFGTNDFNGAAAVAILLLLLGLVPAGLLVTRSGLFKED